MKMKLFHSLLLGVILVGLPVAANAQEKEDKVDVVFGFAFVISPDYHDVLKDAYYDVAGGYGWLDFQLGARFYINKKLSLTPSIDLLINAVTGDDSFINTIILPSLSVRYSFTELPSIYISGEVNYGIPNTGGDIIDADSDGLGFGAAVGYSLKNVEFEVGYLTIPVTINNFRDENFGGFRIKMGFAF